MKPKSAMIPEKSSPAELVESLDSDASFELKARACQRLAAIGTADSVSALAKLLADDKLSDFARYALENIPSPTAGAALLEALPTLKGRLLAGVVNSLAVRQEKAALGALMDLANDPVRGPQSGAIAAIGRIVVVSALADAQTQRALAMLSGVDAAQSEAVLLEIAHTNLAASAALIRIGQADVAKRLLESLVSSKAPAHLREAALALAKSTEQTPGKK
jgi:HEAT repeat protein